MTTLLKCKIFLAEPYTFKKGDKYVGLLYDLWSQIKEKLKDQYTFEETFDTSTNHTEFIKDVSENYDVGIGPFHMDTKRKQYCLFTQPVLIGRNIILYKKKTNYISIILITFVKYFLPVFLILLFLGYIFGNIISRVQGGSNKEKNISSSVSAFLGSKGLISEAETYNFKAIIIITSIVMISSFTFQFLQGFMNHIIEKLINQDDITKENLQYKKLLCPDGYNPGVIIKDTYGCDVTFIKKTMDETVEEYLKNTDKYDGVPINYFTAKHYEYKYKLNVTTDNFTLVLQSFVVNKKDTDLFDKINSIILELNESKDSYKICGYYFKNDADNCVF